MSPTLGQGRKTSESRVPLGKDMNGFPTIPLSATICPISKFLRPNLGLLRHISIIFWSSVYPHNQGNARPSSSLLSSQLCARLLPHRRHRLSRVLYRSSIVLLRPCLSLPLHPIENLMCRSQERYHNYYEEQGYNQEGVESLNTKHPSY